MRAGARSVKIDVLEADDALSVDEYGEPTGTRGVVVSLFASQINKGTRQAVRAGLVENEADVLFTVRYTSLISEGMLIRDSETGVVWDITGIESSPRRSELYLYANRRM